MKKLVLLGALMSLLMLALTGCTGDTNSTSNAGIPNNTYDKRGNLQGKIMDATTGEPIATGKRADYKMYIVRGDGTQEPSRLVYSTTDVLKGEYAFTGIPYTLAGNATYKLVLEIDGYQRFESEFTPQTFWNSINQAAAINTAAGTTLATANNTLDQVINRIGNIYLFKKGQTAAAYKVKVTYNGKAVSGATVQLRQLNNGNYATAINTAVVAAAGAPAANAVSVAGAAYNTRLLPSNGLIPVLSATTGTDGYATFAATDLVLGGSYQPVVLPVSTASTFDSQGAVQLEGKIGNVCQIGAAATVAGAVPGANDVVNAGAIALGTEQTIALTGANNVAFLYAKTVSNAIEGADGIAADQTRKLSADGSITITFNRPVVLNNSRATVSDAGATLAGSFYYGFTAALAGNTSTSATVAVLSTAAAGAAAIGNKPYTAYFDGDTTKTSTGTALTIKPTFSTAIQATDFDLRIVYADGPNGAFNAASLPASVSPVEKPELMYGIFAANPVTGLRVARSNGANISNVVYITAPRNP